MTPVMYTNDWISRAFNDFFNNDYMPRANATAPTINVKETPKNYEVELAAPGARKEDLMVTINDEGNLSIKLERKDDVQNDNKQYHYRSEEHTSELQSRQYLVCRLLLEKNKKISHPSTK